MKIECPNCKLSGEIKDNEVPLDGRYVDCPRCKTGFHVKKTLAKGWNPNMMSSCPACQYSTFTDEMFDVCPKCGLKGSDFNEKKRLREDEARLQKDMEKLNRSLRPDDFVTPPVKEVESEIATAPPTVRYTAVGVLVVASLLGVYGIAGVMNYDGERLLASINETSLEPVSATKVFLTHGLLPTVLAVYGVLMAILAGMLLRSNNDAVRWLEGGAWAGLAIGTVYEVTDYISYCMHASGAPSIKYYALGLVTSVAWLAFWVSIPLGLVWWLRSEKFRNELGPE